MPIISTFFGIVIRIYFSDIKTSQGEMALPLHDEILFARVFLEMGGALHTEGQPA